MNMTQQLEFIDRHQTYLRFKERAELLMILQQFDIEDAYLESNRKETNIDMNKLPKEVIEVIYNFMKEYIDYMNEPYEHGHTFHDKTRVYSIESYREYQRKLTDANDLQYKKQSRS